MPRFYPRLVNRIMFVVDVGHDFKGDMREAASWLESLLDQHSMFSTEVTAYRTVEDLTFDYRDQEGAFKPEEHPEMTKPKDESQHPNYDLLCMVQDICGDIRRQRAMLNSIERQLADLLALMRTKP